MSSGSFTGVDEAAAEILNAANAKAERNRLKSFVLAILAGVCIALGAYASILVRLGVSIGLGKALAGLVFSTGLIMITFIGAELFTGNVLMTLSFLEKRIKFSDMLKNWVVVYLGNFAGALIIVLLVFLSASQTQNFFIFSYSIAANKVNLTPLNCFASGILCNLLVCMAVYMAQCSKDASGKIFSIIFPIMIFIVRGYEHCVANMFFIPSGMASEYLLNGSVSISLVLAVKNLVFVTLGNIFGAFLFVALPLWLHCKK